MYGCDLCQIITENFIQCKALIGNDFQMSLLSKNMSRDSKFVLSEYNS